MVLVIPGPEAITVPWFNFSWFFSGMKIPDAVWVAGLTLWIKTLSNNGCNALTLFNKVDWGC